jgi:hypothetical protein
MIQATQSVVRKDIVVEAPVERAFTVFTERFGDFKPPEHNLLSSPRPYSSRGSAGTSMTAPSMAANAAGHGFSPTSRRSASCSAGTSTRNGRSRPMWRTQVKSRFGSSPRPQGAPGWNSSIATSTGTAPAGPRSAMAWHTSRDGRCTWIGSPHCCVRTPNDRKPLNPLRQRARRLRQPARTPASPAGR